MNEHKDIKINTVDMDTELASGIDLDLDAQSILLAASEHDIAALRKLLRGSSANPANVKDPDTGYSPLHSAIASCEDDENQNPAPNGNGSSATNGQTTTSQTEEEKAVETVKYLLQNGAIWNDLDAQSETPGCIAKRLGLKQLYEIMVDAGVRAEMLLSRLDEYEQLDDDSADEGGDEEIIDISVPNNESETAASNEGGTSGEKPQEISNPSVPDVNSEDYLHSALTFSQDRLVDQDKNGVMMAWESEIMKRSVEAMVPTEGLKVLNVGHGMGIIDEMIQSKSPVAHHIIEAHPAVLENMKKNGWYDKPGVTVHGGKWQDVVPKLLEEMTTFDAIYFDTFAEDYKALRKFFDEFVVGLLEESGRFSFFNGLGADRQVCYDVYTKVVEMDLLECGFDVDWTMLDVPDLEENSTWEGLKRPYWKLDKYKLPVVTFLT